MANEKESVATLGCALSLLQFFIQFPLWCAILVGLCLTVQPPTWVWICVIAYMPVGFFLGISRALVEAVLES